jgi:cysteine desulfurase
LRALRTRLERELVERVADLRFNASGAERLPHVLNVSIRQVDQEALLISLDLEGIAVSSGSACQSGTVEPSHVLSAMGRAQPDEASIRISLGRTTTDAEITQLIHLLPRVIEKLRSPLLATGIR